MDGKPNPETKLQAAVQSGTLETDRVPGPLGAGNPGSGAPDNALVEILAENQRLRALSEAQKTIHQLQSQNTVSARLGNVMTQSVKSPGSLLSVPVKLGKIWLEAARRTPPRSMGGKDFDKVILAYRDGGFAAVEKLMDTASLAPAIRADGYKALTTYLRERDRLKAAEAARRAYGLNPTRFRLKWLAFRLRDAGELVEAEALLDILPADTPFNDFDKHQAARIRDEAKQIRQRDAKEKIGRQPQTATGQSASPAKPLTAPDRQIETPRQETPAAPLNIHPLRPTVSAALWKGHENKIEDKARGAAEIIRDSGFIPARIYGNLATIANELKLPLLADNTRFLQMGLLAQEIERRGTPGAIAELGVYRGGFTQFISRAFKKRRYYLFDTFEGFAEHQIAADAAKFAADGHDFKNTSVEMVLKLVDKASECEMVVKQGFFPATAEGVDDTFVFVSLDADLYDPTIDGLRFFYPRLAKGGYIMVHDLMADRYKGCRQAVYEFCEEMGISFAPLPDSICSALFIKN